VPTATIAAVVAASLVVLAFQPNGSHSPKVKPSSAAPVLPALASLTQFAAPVHEKNNVWVLPGILPASDAAMLTAKGLISASWAPGMGGVIVSDANYVVTLTGESPDGLTITNITTTNVKRSMPLAGTLIAIGSQGENADQQYRSHGDRCRLQVRPPSHRSHRWQGADGDGRFQQNHFAWGKVGLPRTVPVRKAPIQIPDAASGRGRQLMMPWLRFHATASAWPWIMPQIQQPNTPMKPMSTMVRNQLKT
jgi:hypothetical protein